MQQKIISEDTSVRAMKDVPPPLRHKLEIDDFYDTKNKVINISKLQVHLSKEGRLTEKAAIFIIKECMKILRDEPTLLQVSEPVNIIGDIHGQYYDLLKIFDVGGDPKDKQYLFLGDYVDRGSFSTECVLLLWALKISFPSNMFLLRGNHECRHLTAHFTFKKECALKYSLKFYNKCMESFDCLPLAAVVQNRFLCLHGGLSPEIHTLDDIESINRFKEIPSYGAICDLLWGDPTSNFGEETSPELFTINNVRGCAYNYSYYACSEFLLRNNLLSIIRAHEPQDEGYRMYKINVQTGFPSLMTIFSAPNYLDVYKNKGALIHFENNEINIKQYKASSHPFWLPNFMDVFTWSLPYVMEKTTEILLVILRNYKVEDNTSNMDDSEAVIKALEESAHDPLEESIPTEGNEEINKKEKAISSVSKVFSKWSNYIFRVQNERQLNLKGITGHYTPDEDSISNPSLVNFDKEIETFSEAQELDKHNKKIPPMMAAIKTVILEMEDDVENQLDSIEDSSIDINVEADDKCNKEV